jgi:hypothetical protein
VYILRILVVTFQGLVLVPQSILSPQITTSSYCSTNGESKLRSKVKVCVGMSRFSCWESEKLLVLVYSTLSLIISGVSRCYESTGAAW